MPKNYSVYEPDDVHDIFTKEPDIAVGDTVEYVSNNQMGYEQYEVILDENGKKTLKLTKTYDDMMDNIMNSADDEDTTDDEKSVGGRRRKKGGSKKRKVSKKRKTRSLKKRKTRSLKKRRRSVRK